MLRRDDAALVVVDVQEAFRKVIPDFDEIAAKTATLVEGARILGVPTIVTEQYPKGLGTTVSEAGIDGHPVLEKTVFAASQADGFDLQGRTQVMVCGIEAHVCVHQTVEDLSSKGVEVHLLTDAVSSRDPHNKQIAIERAKQAGAIPTTTEMALLELCQRAGTPEFKEVQRLIK
ncbi:MAG: Isochorismatase [uncultured Solirubrobacteraceae bacterium]|uniref:Isochorismatase n=1 Tax=uncultured Solirubrobacteraceae bacterium TaxID=1162706 RepID=A0A6J4TLJ7_9ACTN|nr:MAG: Isochorismatase [uncultured Solirubrobacteraceae bacterium]